MRPFGRSVYGAQPLASWLAVLILLVVSGNPAVRVIDDSILYPAVLALVIALTGLKFPQLDALQAWFCGAFTVIVLWHYAEFGSASLIASVGFLTKVAMAILVANRVDQFGVLYIKLMVGLSAISLLIFMPYYLGLPVYELLRPMAIDAGGAERHVVIHNFGREGLQRNSGMFWEPGALGAYICLAFVFLRIYRVKLPLWQVLTLWTALGSTFSTASYIAGSLILAWWLFPILKDRFGRGVVVLGPILAVSVLGVGIFAFSEIDFLGQKIFEQFERAQNEGYLHQINRFGNFFYDLELIRERPIFGWSAYLQTRTSFDQFVFDFLSGQGNGLSGFATNFGLFGAFIYFWCFFLRLLRINQSYWDVIFGIGVVCITLSSQKLLNYPVFLTLPFLARGDFRAVKFPRTHTWRHADVYRIAVRRESL